MNVLQAAAASLSFLLLTAPAIAGTGDLDPLFGTSGVAKLGFAEGRAVNVKGSAKQQDGKIVVVGDIASPDDGLQHVVFSRLNNDGTLDTTFGTAGWTIMVAPRPSTPPYTPVTCSAVGVARGSATITALATCEGSITLFSVNYDGTPNVNFGSWYGSGSRIDEYGAQLTARAIAVDSQGRIIVGGSRRTSPTTASNAFMKRYLGNGVGDANFGSAFGMAGLSTQSLALGDDELLALAVDGTDRIVGVGYGTASLGGSRFMLATRFQANGTIGPFGMTNNAWVSYTGEGDTARAVAIQGDGTIVVAGTAGYTHWNGQSSSKFYVWRIGDNGYTTSEGAQVIDMPIAMENDADASATALHITQDNWIVMIGGTVSNASGTRTAYACVYPDNRLATICGSGGRYFAPASLDGGSVLGLYTASDYKFVSVGSKGNAVAVARFNNSEAGVADATFGNAGAATYAPWVPTQVALNGLALQADGKLIVAATSTSGAARVGRLDGSGQLDTAFGTGGYYDLGVDGNLRALGAHAAAVQPDGKILVALRSEVIAGSNAGEKFANVIRLNADGSRDPSWYIFAGGATPAALAVKADGRVLMLSTTAAPAERMVLTQFGTDGSIVSNATLLSTGAEAEVAAALALDANGNALAAGYTRQSGVLRMVAYRYSDTLQPDWTWAGGFSIVDFGVSSAARGIAIRADGKVVLAGACGDGAPRACFARLESNGQLDASFGTGGRVVHSLSPSGERAVSAHVTPEGKTFAAIDHLGGLGIALVGADGTLDPAVAGTGFNLPATGGDAIASVMQADGRVVVAGSDGSPENAAWILARFARDVVVPPDTMLTYAPLESPTTSRDATMTFVSTKPGSTFECSVGPAPFSPCTSPVTMQGLPEGTYTFRVRAIDTDGLPDPTPAVRTWTIDLPPDVTITSGPSGLTRTWPAVFTFASNDPAATFQCRLDGPTGMMLDAPCPASFLVAVADGAYQLRVRARDAGGNLSTEAVRAFTMDTQPPSVVITGMPPNPSTSDVATFTFSANEAGAVFECLFDASNFSPCASPLTRTGLPPGQHAFVVRAIDAAGNVGTPVSYPWTVNLPAVPPDTTITSGPSGMVSGPAVYTFVSSVLPATFECRVDGFALWFQCASPMNLGIPPPGMHSFEVRAINAYGPDLTPATASWSQAGVPDTTISPVGPPPAPSVTFTFTSTIAGSTFECSIDAGAYVPCATPYTLTAPSGVHNLAVRARWGNDVDPSPAQSPFAILDAAPETTITSGPSGVITGSAVYAFASNVSAAVFECRVDGSAYFACANPISLGGASPGLHTFEVRAINPANGVPDPTPATASWGQAGVPDTTVSPSTPPPPAPSVTFTFTSSIPGATFECRIDAAAFAACASPYTLTGPPGVHTLAVRARWGNDVDPTPAQSPFYIDAPPETTITQTPPAVTTLTTATFRYASTPAGGSFECKLDNFSFATCSPGGITYTGLSHTPHTFQVRARNSNGTLDPTPATYAWRVQ
ncbi:hypothetical protein BWI17_20770 [Betaproteobacteria bacterium GR16-43]|nr:hypothetical protein BWI17_20770 [Betaproteobacteria bacterium GR16-43]